MDDDTRQFLTSLVGGLENNLRGAFAGVENDWRRELREMESRILQHTEELITEAKVELLDFMRD